MTAPAPSPTRPRRTDGPAPARIAAVAAVAVVINVGLALLLRAATGTSAEFLPLQPGPVAVATLVGVLAGALLLLLLRRFLTRPEPVFTTLVVLGAVLSLAGPLQLLNATPAEQPGVTDAAALSLVPLHLVPAAALLLGGLVRRPGRRTSSSR